VEFPGDGDRYDRWLRGAPHHDDPFTGRFRPGEQVRLELVAERFNRHDSHAVAVDFEGSRVGYVPAGDAARWHDVLLALNRSGRSVWTCGQVQVGQYEGLRRLTVSLSLATLQNLCVLADRTGLTGVVERLLAVVSDDERAEAFECAWDDELPRSLARRLAAHAPAFPELTWPSCPPEGVKHRVGAPGLLTVVLRELVLRERREVAARREQERAERAARREVEEAAKRAERVARRAEREA
jgi:hypothetical protein